MTVEEVRATFSRDEARALVRAAKQAQVTQDPTWTHRDMQSYHRAVRILDALANDTWGDEDRGQQH